MDLKDISLQAITRPITQVLRRYHVIIFTVVALGGLAIAVYSFYHIIIDAESDSSSPAGQSISFDSETIEALGRLQESGSSKNISLPDGRINPFIE